MLGSDVIGFTQQRLERVWSSRLSVLLQPASSGPLRHLARLTSEIISGVAEHQADR